MQKKNKRRPAQRPLIAAIAVAFVLAVAAIPAKADLGAQSFSDGASHTVTDNIVASGNIGLDVFNAGTVVNMSGYSITGDFGVEAWAGGRINLTNVAVTADGNGGTAGVISLGTTAVVAMTGGAIAATGRSMGAFVRAGFMSLNGVRISTDGGYGATTDVSGTMNLTGSSITVRGDDTFGLISNGGGSITMAGGSLTATGARSHAVAAFGGTIAINNVDITAPGADSYALYSRGSGTISATVSGQQISGAGGLIYADTGSTTNLIATGTSRLYGTTAMNGSGAANLTLGGNAVWTMPGDSALTTLAMNGGTVSFTAPSGGYKTLGIAGSLSGSGGVFRLNASLPTGQSDLFEIHGAASGSHQVFVVAQGGPGNPYQAVKVVDLNEVAANTAVFSGGGDIGPYRYGVARGAVVPAGYAGIGSPDDIYLYNTLAPSTPASAAVSTAASSGVLWYGEMNDIKKRLGELRLGAPTDNVWARTHAEKHVIKPRGGQSFDQLSHGLEVGSDKASGFDGGTRYLGWVAGIGRADNSFDAGGSGVSDSVFLGAYGSWLADDGVYLDVVGKYNRFRHAFSAPLLGGGSDSAAYGTTGFGFSVEAGRRMERNDGVFVEPQVELATLRSQGKDYTTANGLRVAAPAANSLQLRLGAAFGRKTLVEGGARQFYGKLSWVEELAGQGRTAVDAASFDASLKGGRLVLGLGVMEDTESRQIYLDVETSRGPTTSKPWGFNLGCRWKF
ncbi:MAG TPA: autotransporter outer membrane beta-barrel domain-containing protein [Rhodocyclaceae bacterium]